MNKASGGDGIPVELLQTLKDYAVKVLHSICQQIWSCVAKGLLLSLAEPCLFPAAGERFARAGLHPSTSSVSLSELWELVMDRDKNTGVGCHFLLQCMKGKSALLSFPNLLAYSVQHFHSIIFWDLQ